MKKHYILFFSLFIAASAIAQRPLITKWNAADGNIKIPTVGSYNYTYRKADNAGITGSGTGTSGATVINFPSAGTYTVEITPTSTFKFDYVLINLIGTDKTELIELSQWGDVNWNTDLSFMLYGCSKLQVSAIDTPDFSAVTDMRGMFFYAEAFNAPINHWDVSNVTNMSAMFANAKTFNQALNSWNTSNVTDMANMFNGATAFNYPLNSWNVGNVTSIRSMFYNATSFSQDINNWNTSKVTDMANVFYGATVFNKPLDNWNVGSVTNMSNMFTGATIFNQNLNGWDTSKVTKMSGMFLNAAVFNSPLSNWNVSSVQDMDNMFTNATNFNQNLNSWDTSSVTFMSGMFSNAVVFNSSVSNWNVGNVGNMYNMFNNATAFNQNLSSWNLNSAGLYMQNMLDNSGMNCENYSRTLKGWAQNPTTPSGITLGAIGRTYGTEAQQYRTSLVNDKGWTISGDGYDAGCTVTLSAGEINPAAHRLNVYPIPTRGVFFLESEVAGTARLYNGAGQEVRSFPMIKGKNTLNISSLPAGMYVISAEGQSVRILKN